MSNKPHFKFYPKDYLGDTAHLDIESHGLYMLTLMHLWINDGYISLEKLRDTLHLTPKKFEKKWKKIEEFFQKSDKKNGKIFQKRLLASVENYYRICEINRENALSKSQSVSEPQANRTATLLSHKAIKPISHKEKKKVDESSFPFLSNDSFKENWNSHLSMTGVNKTIKSQEMRLKKLHEVSVEGATKSLEDSIANGWRGVFPKEGTLQTTKRLQSITMFSEKDKEALLGPLDYSILVRYKANEEMSVEDLNRYTEIQGMKFSK